MFARNDRCESLVLNDLGATKIAGTLKVHAHRRFAKTAVAEYDDTTHEITLDAGTVRLVDRKTKKTIVVGAGAVVDAESSGGTNLKRVRLVRAVHVGDTDLVEAPPFTFEVHPRSLTLQQVKLASGELGFASGNMVIHAKEGAPAFDDLAKLGLSLDTVNRSDVPERSPEVKVKQDELSAEVTSIALASHADDPSIDRGRRRLTVKWKIAVDSTAMEARLGDKATGKDAERTVKAERAKVMKGLACDGIQLVTNKTTRSAWNKGDAGKACALLDAVEGTDFVLSYDIDRYEIPVALSYAVGKTKTFSPIASEALMAFDAR